MRLYLRLQVSDKLCDVSLDTPINYALIGPEYVKPMLAAMNQYVPKGGPYRVQIFYYVDSLQIWESQDLQQADLLITSEQFTEQFVNPLIRKALHGALGKAQ